jgi:hypothetical protein
MEYRLYPGRYEIECGTASLDVPFQSISTCVGIKRAVRSWLDIMMCKGVITRFSYNSSYLAVRSFWRNIALMPLMRLIAKALLAFVRRIWVRRLEHLVRIPDFVATES